ncbi:MAG: 50S ribosomal protein L11 methyltransferase, partial [bacterium]
NVSLPIMKHPKRHWLLVKFPYLLESAEAVSYYLFERGALGCEEKDGCQFAYFDDRDNDNLLAKLEQDARQIIACGLKLPSGPITISRIPEQDWHLAWRQFFKPVNIQNKLIVRPPWEKIDLPAAALKSCSNRSRPSAPARTPAPNSCCAPPTNFRSSTPICSAIFSSRFCPA